jgi:hypothetical protein
LLARRNFCVLELANSAVSPSFVKSQILSAADLTLTASTGVLERQRAKR